MNGATSSLRNFCGRAKPVIDSVYPLADAQAAHERLESGRHFGKVLLRIPD